MKQIPAILLFLCSCFLHAQDWPWEKYGLSQTEWKIITDNNISIPKLEDLLKIGIDVGEYVAKPWVELGMSEDKWVSRRAAGLSSNDIELETQKGQKHWKNDIRTGMGSDFDGVAQNRALISSLLLPGYQQLRAGRSTKGSLMAALAIGSLAWCVVGSTVKDEFQILPIGVVLLPDMLWSMIDFKVNKKKYIRSVAHQEPSSDLCRVKLE